jgi:drug/metabolite transporter (DMT)-like permease
VKPQTNRQALTGSALILLGAVGFSAKSILIKLAYGGSTPVDAVTLMTLRMLMSLPFFLLVALWSRPPRDRVQGAGDWAAVVVLGVIGYYLASLLDFLGLQYIPAGLERLILFLYPTMVVVLTALLYRRPIAVAQRWALLFCYVGILLVYGKDPQAGSADLGLGALLVFGSALTFAVYLTGSGHYIPRFGSRRFTAYSMSVACLATIVHFLIVHLGDAGLSALRVSPQVLALAAAMALLSTVAPAFLMNAGIARLGADRASIVGSIGPILTLAMAYLFLGETLVPMQIAGCAMVLGGVLLVTLWKR